MTNEIYIPKGFRDPIKPVPIKPEEEFVLGEHRNETSFFNIRHIPESMTPNRAKEIKEKFLVLAMSRRSEEALMLIQELFPQTVEVIECSDTELRAKGIEFRYVMHNAMQKTVGMLDFTTQELMFTMARPTEEQPEFDPIDIFAKNFDTTEFYEEIIRLLTQVREANDVQVHNRFVGMIADFQKGYISERRFREGVWEEIVPHLEAVPEVDGSPEAECADKSAARRVGHTKFEDLKTVSDDINHPSHYTQYKDVEVIDITEVLSFNRGNAIKYLARAGWKNPETEIEDLKKALWYTERALAAKHEVYFHYFQGYRQIDRLIEQMNYHRGSAVWLLATAGRGRTHPKGNPTHGDIQQDLTEAKYAIKSEIKRLEDEL